VKAAAIAAAGYPLAAVLGRTLTWRVEGAAHYDEIARSGRPPILVFWHGRILPATLYWRNRGIVVMTSRNFDGEWIARIIAQFGYDSARGSSSRGGARALVQLRRDLEAGRPVAFTLDGPRGPAEVAQPGAVWLAGATGHPMLPFHIEAARFWTASSWDRTQVPRPFTTVGVAIGPPVLVTGTSTESIERHRVDLERRLGLLQERARELSR
jgi:lysophospholipid acyltransferase (LPLAT)-like uncharacterized protein